MTATDIIQHVRNLNRDDDPVAQEWSDEQYILAINEAYRTIADLHPESRLSSTGTLLSVTEASAGSPDTDLTFPAALYRQPVIDFVLYRYYMAEGGDVRDNSRAGAYLARFDSFFR